MKNEILLVEDDSSLASALRHVLELAGYSVTSATTGEEGLQRANEERFDAILADFKLPGLNGLDLVKEIHAANRRVPILLMTAHGTSGLAIEATRSGAYDYLLKPFEMPAMLAMIANAVVHFSAEVEPGEPGGKETPPSILIGNSRPMQAIYKEIGRVASTTASVLICGESGTGKELVARAIWQHSKRAAKPLVVVNCTAIPETLVESEMFGHERGAFTGADVRRIGRFEQAQGGTLFLDEVGDMTVPTQAKLLRVLQDRIIQRVGGRDLIPIDVRVVAATHRDLQLAIAESRFREDLFYRLNVVSITVPPLRERSEDIPALVRHFLLRLGIEMGIENRSIQREAIEFLQHQPWPGNVRELENIVRRALLVAPGYPITLGDVRRVMATRASNATRKSQSLSALVKESLTSAANGKSTEVYAELVGTLERELFTEAMRLSGGNQVRAARWLGISRLTLRQRLRRLDLKEK
jgi:nitrogen regulation protein NR(I)